jgi:hypothetical protein
MQVEGQTTQWTKEKGQKDKYRSKKKKKKNNRDNKRSSNTNTTKDRG